MSARLQLLRDIREATAAAPLEWRWQLVLSPCGTAGCAIGCYGNSIGVRSVLTLVDKVDRCLGKRLAGWLFKYSVAPGWPFSTSFGIAVARTDVIRRLDKVIAYYERKEAIELDELRHAEGDHMFCVLAAQDVQQQKPQAVAV